MELENEQKIKYKITKLGNIINLKRGYDLPKQKRVEGSIPVISSSGINGFHNSYKVQGPGVTIGRSGKIGGSFYIKNNFWPLNTTLYVQDFKDNDVLFIYYLLKTINFKFLNAGSSVPTLNRNHAHEINIKTFEINIQKRISSILFTIDKKIEVNNKIIANLEEQAQAIFRSWFVDFEPFQDGNFVESELGMIPEIFKIVKLGDIYPLKSGYAFKSKDWTDRGFPIIKIKNINDGSIDFSDVDYVDNKNTLKLASKFRVYGTEIVIALTGATTGKFGVIPYKSDAYVNQRVGLFFDKLDIGNGFLYGLLNQKSIIENIIEMAQGSAQSNLSPRDVNNLKIIYCEKCKNINKILNYFLEMVCKLLYQNKKLAEIRDALLPKLMAGEIDVSNIKIKGEEVKNE